MNYRNFQNIFQKSVDIWFWVWYRILAGGRYPQTHRAQPKPRRYIIMKYMGMNILEYIDFLMEEYGMSESDAEFVASADFGLLEE